jgi:hypothetical protein
LGGDYSVGFTPWDASKVTKLQWQIKDGVARAYSFAIDEVSVMGKVLDLPTVVTPDPVDKTLLAAAITSATTLHTTSVEGSAAGQYPAGSKATLLQAINNASLVNSNVDATQIEVDAALLALNTAVSTFQASANGAPPGGNTLIADCEDENITKLQTFWYSYAAGQSTISPLASVTVPFEMTAGGANGTAHAAAVTGSLAYPGAPVATGQPGYESAGIGFAFLDPEADYDLTGATGISFYHKGDAINFSVIISITAQDAGHDYSYAVPASVNWQLVTVNFPGQGAPAIAQPAWVGSSVGFTPWDASKVTKLQWQIKDGVARAYSFAIDEVSVMGKVLDLPTVVTPDPVNKTLLAAAIVQAKAARDAATYGTQPGQYPVSAGMALENAIAAAEFVANNASATQTQVDDARTTLLAAIASFEASVNPDPGIDVTALSAKITQAQTTLSTASIGTLVGQHPQSAADNLTAAIATAQSLANNPTTQAAVNTMVTTLNTAINTFLATTNPPVAANTLIADCEDENITKLQTFWYSYAAGQSTISPLASVTVPFEMTAGGANGTANAAVVSGELVNTGDPDYESAGIGFAFLDPEADYDLTGATGISFYHKGDAINFSVIISITAQDAGHDYSYAVPASVNWQLVTVNFPGQGAPAIAQPAWVGSSVGFTPWDASKVTKLQWQIKDGVARAYSFAIDEVSVMGKVLDLPTVITPDPVNKTTLLATLVQANSIKNAAVVGTQPGQYPSVAYSTFTSAITTAQGVANNTSATQIQVDQANTTLLAAIASFEGAVNPEPNVDVTALTAKISEANTTLSSASIGTLEGQHPQSAANNLTSAIATAQSLANSPTTQAAVNTMVTTLNTAINTFLATTNPPTGLVDKSTLASNIAITENVYNAAVEGTASGQYEVGAKAELHIAITAAKTVHNNANATQTQVNQAVSALQDALSVFQSKLVGVTKTALQTLINTAQQAYDSGVEGNLEGQYPPTVKQELYFALNTAQTALISTSATQVQIDQAVLNLQNALADYNASVNPAQVSKDELNLMLQAAESLYYDSPYQYPFIATVNFYSAIQTASQVYANQNAMQYEVNTATQNLEAAMIAYQSTRTTSVEDVSRVIVQAYPNPASSFIMVKAEQQIKALAIVNAQSQVVISEAVQKTQIEISLQQLSSGTYVIHIQFEDGTQISVPFVKQ